MHFSNIRTLQDCMRQQKVSNLRAFISGNDGDHGPAFTPRLDGFDEGLRLASSVCYVGGRERGALRCRSPQTTVRPAQVSMMLLGADVWQRLN